MNKTAKIVSVVIIVAIIVIGGVVWYTKSHKKENTDMTTSTESTHQDTANVNTPDANIIAATITYDGQRFEPSVTTVKSGDTIKITNQSQDRLEFASDPHPTHTTNPQLNTGDIDPGSSKTITVTTKGTWGVHNHYNSSQKATVVVE